MLGVGTTRILRPGWFYGTRYLLFAFPRAQPALECGGTPPLCFHTRHLQRLTQRLARRAMPRVALALACVAAGACIPHPGHAFLFAASSRARSRQEAASHVDGKSSLWDRSTFTRRGGLFRLSAALAAPLDSRGHPGAQSMRCLIFKACPCVNVFPNLPARAPFTRLLYKISLDFASPLRTLSLSGPPCTRVMYRAIRSLVIWSLPVTSPHISCVRATDPKEAPCRPLFCAVS